MADCSIYKRNVFSSPLATVQTLHILHTQHWGLIKAAAFSHCVAAPALCFLIQNIGNSTNTVNDSSDSGNCSATT